MPSSSSNRIVIAAAGSGKTARLIEEALREPLRRVLIVTYTEENQRQLRQRIGQRCGGSVPQHVTIMGWFDFLISQCAKPYQSFVVDDVNRLRALNFVSQIPKGPSREGQPRAYYLDRHRDLYRNRVAEFAYFANLKSNGLTMRRLEAIWDVLLIDEVQDLAGWDLEILIELFRSRLEVFAVGDPRQVIYLTANVNKNKQYAWANIVTWFQRCETQKLCTIETMTESERCCQAVCDFADSLHPDLPATTSRFTDYDPHLGVHSLARNDVTEYVARYAPNVLRYDKTSDTMGLLGLNMGESKGSTYERVLLFPTKDMAAVLSRAKGPDSLAAVTRNKLYVAVTRARKSVAFVAPATKKERST